MNFGKFDFGNVQSRDVRIPLRDINIDESYQRGENAATVKAITENFQPVLYRRPVIAVRPDGSFWVPDGGQRVRGGRGLKKRVVDVSLFKSEGPEMEAAAFLALNTGSMRPPRPIDHFRAGICAKDAIYLEIDEIARTQGFIIPYKHEPSSGVLLNCPRALIAVHTQDGGSPLVTILDTINQAWGGSSDCLRRSTNEQFIRGFGLLFRRYGTAIKEQRLVKVLASTTPATIKHKSDAQTTTGWSRYKALAFQIGHLYNLHLRRGRLKNLETLSQS